MIPVVLMAAYSLCMDNLNFADLARPASYNAGYEQCATIVPYVDALIRAEKAPEIARKHAEDMAKLAAAMAAIQSKDSK